MDIRNTRFTSIEQATEQYFNTGSHVQPEKTSDVSFSDILNDKFRQKEQISGLKFSRHAAQRLSDRNIELSDEQLDRLGKGAKLSSDKGIRESLVLMDDYAFIVNTQKNTVITAMEKSQDENNVYTNIDGAVLV